MEKIRIGKSIAAKLSRRWLQECGIKNIRSSHLKIKEWASNPLEIVHLLETFWDIRRFSDKNTMYIHKNIDLRKHPQSNHDICTYTKMNSKSLKRKSRNVQVPEYNKPILNWNLLKLQFVKTNFTLLKGSN